MARLYRYLDYLHQENRLRLFFIALFAGLSSFSASNSLPDLGQETAGFTSQQEMILGKTWLRGFRRSVNELNSPLLMDYLNEHINNLKQQTNLDPTPINHIVVNDSSLNAFAVPGHIMGINSGLFLTAGDETQFLSVISHELAHLELKHFNQQINKQSDLKGLQLLTIISSIVAAQYSINIGEAILASGLASAQTQSLSYSRSLETAADQRANSIMANAGYPANSVYLMLNSLMRQSLNTSDAAPEYFRTHPLSQSRVADSLKLNHINSNQIKNSSQNSLDYELILLMLTRHHGFSAANEGNNETDNFKIAKLLIDIDTLLSASHLDSAKLLIDSIPTKYKNEIAYQVRLTNYYYAKGELSEALDLVSTYLALKPDSVRLVLLKAKLLKENGHLPAAIQILRERASGLQTNPWLWQKTLEYSKLSDNAWAQLEAQLQYHWLSGEDQATVRMIENNLYSDKWSAVEKSRLKDWLQQYNEEIKLIETTF